MKRFEIESKIQDIYSGFWGIAARWEGFRAPLLVHSPKATPLERCQTPSRRRRRRRRS
jgi:hypothetical protein